MLWSIAIHVNDVAIPGLFTRRASVHFRRCYRFSVTSRGDAVHATADLRDLNSLLDLAGLFDNAIRILSFNVTQLTLQYNTAVRMGSELSDLADVRNTHPVNVRVACGRVRRVGN